LVRQRQTTKDRGVRLTGSKQTHNSPQKPHITDHPGSRPARQTIILDRHAERRDSVCKVWWKW